MFLILIGFAGCVRDKSKPEQKDEGVESDQPLPALRIGDDVELVFTYKKKKTFETVYSIDEIPASARGWVGVMDPRKTAGSGRRVYVADLCRKQEDGSYAYKVLPRDVFESKGPVSCFETAGGTRSTDVNGKGVGDEKRVVVYITRTCPVCMRAMEFLEKQGIPFVAKDIDKDPTAAKTLARKASAAGLRVSGVPVFDISGRLILGFDPGELLRALKEKR